MNRMISSLWFTVAFLFILLSGNIDVITAIVQVNNFVLNTKQYARKHDSNISFSL